MRRFYVRMKTCEGSIGGYEPDLCHENTKAHKVDVHVTQSSWCPGVFVAESGVLGRLAVAVAPDQALALASELRSPDTFFVINIITHPISQETSGPMMMPNTAWAAT